MRPIFAPGSVWWPPRAPTSTEAPILAGSQTYRASSWTQRGLCSTAESSRVRLRRSSTCTGRRHTFSGRGQSPPQRLWRTCGSSIRPMATTPLTFERLRTAGVAEVDPEVAALLERELERERDEIELIASENFTWRATLEAVGSVPTNKYSEGYPGRRYYGGCELVDEIEQLAIDRAKALFGAEHANVQPHAGAQTNMAVYFA